MSRIGVVVVAYRNAPGLKRCLNSLAVANVFDALDLIISIDGNGYREVEEVAEAFCWEFGSKQVIKQAYQMGLKPHILRCGDYMQEFSYDALIVLEDDIVVSPAFYQYVRSGYDFYHEEKNIAGLSLYKHEFNINARQPFIPISNGYDTFFMQYAQSWGQVWFREPWCEFRQWLAEEKFKKMDAADVPQNVLNWKYESWLKYHVMYCIDQHKYFVYPYTALSTNFSDVGVHSSVTSTAMQVPMQYAGSKKYQFQPFNKGCTCYDAFFENENLWQIVHKQQEETTVDLFGKKKKSARYLLSRKKMNYEVLQSWGLNLRPQEANIVLNIKGEDIFLYDTYTTKQNTCRNRAGVKQYEYDLKGIYLFNKSFIAFFVHDFFQKALSKINMKKRKWKNRNRR